MHAALGDPLRLAIVDELTISDRSPKELGERLGIASNLLAHHLDVLDDVGLISRVSSAGDGRRKYVQLTRGALAGLHATAAPEATTVLFLCTHNSARSQLAAALWSARTGEQAHSAGTHPADQVHPGAMAAARRAGLLLQGAVPTLVGTIPPATQVVTVCDRVHEELSPDPTWWHWSIPDPTRAATEAAFDAVVAELDARIGALSASRTHTEGNAR